MRPSWTYMILKKSIVLDLIGNMICLNPTSCPMLRKV